MKIKIAHLQLLPLMSGVQKVTLDELKFTNRELYDPCVICKEAGEFTEKIGGLNINVFFISELTRKLNPLADLISIIKLYIFFRNKNFDIVHTHSSKTGILGRVAAKLAGVPVIIHTVHGFAFPAAKNPIEKFMYYFFEWIGSKCSTAIVLLNKNDLLIAKNDLNVPDERLYLIPNGVDSDIYFYANYQERINNRKERLNLYDDSVAIGMVGRLWEQKNPECFVKAAIKSLTENNLNANFYLIGDGELKESLQTLIANSGFESSIHILGWRSDVAEILRSLDIFILPSRWEGLPLSILEAMASRIPVIASDIPGNRDLIENEYDGYLFPSQDYIMLSKNINILSVSPELRAIMGGRGYLKFKQKFMIQDRMILINQLYKSLVKK
jgi:glycosyltransferase involved in cell wall biosynthesis